MSGATMPVTPGSGNNVQGSNSSASNFLQSVGIEDKDSGVVQSILDAGTGQHAALVAGAFKELSRLSAGALNADLVPSTDVSAYTAFRRTISGTWVATLTFQGSNDGANWTTILVYKPSLATIGGTASTNE